MDPVVRPRFITRALTPFLRLQICRWGRRCPPGTRDDQHPVFATTGVSFSWKHRHMLCLPLISVAECSGFDFCRVLEKFQSLTCLLSLLMHSLLNYSCSSCAWWYGQERSLSSLAPVKRPWMSPQSLAAELNSTFGNSLLDEVSDVLG